MKERTVREIGGELWDELSREVQATRDCGKGSLLQLDFRAINAVVDIVMGVLARHQDELIVNDKDLPVEPLSLADISDQKPDI